MDFGKEGFISSEEEQMTGKGKLPFSYSSSSSPSPSSSQHKTQQLAPSLTNSRWEQHQQQQPGNQIYRMSPNWLGSRAPYVPDEEDNEPRNEADDSANMVESADSTLELMSSTTSAASGSNSNSNNIEKEHMFDKVVTPSDVGKLNRLVIPKQHAEKYFPLDSSANEKGLLLNFEDRNGKPWRFRYSYWNSSQSYVMTKGWSRFVKDKKLDAGDVVSFQRGLGELGKDRLFIDWRRRPDADQVSFHQPHHYSTAGHHPRSVPWSPLLMRPPQQTGRNHMHLSHINYPQSRNINYYGGGDGYTNNPSVVNNPMGSVFYLRSAEAAAPGMGMMEWQQKVVGGGVVFDSVPVVQGKAAAKRLRLFGVNMECPAIPESTSDDVCEMLTANPAATMAISSQLPPRHQLISSSSSSSTHHHHHPLQLRLYNGTPLPPSTHDFLNANKGKANSSLSLDLDM